MRDSRVGFCYQELPALRILHKRFLGKQRNTALGIYQAMTYVANARRSRDGFAAARGELADLAGVSKRAIDAYAAEFVSLGLLEVERRKEGEVNLPNLWTICTPGAPEDTRGSAANSTQQIEEEKTKKSEILSREKYPLSHLMADLIQAADPNGVRPSVSKGWATAERLLTEKDGRTLTDAEALLRWAKADDFWAPNIRSMTKFREKYAQLWERRSRESKPTEDTYTGFD